MAERQLLKETLASIDSTQLTPRSIRAFILRYQLVRLLAQRLGVNDKDFPVAKVLDALARRFCDPAATLDGLRVEIQESIEMVSGDSPDDAPVPSTSPKSQV